MTGEEAGGEAQPLRAAPALPDEQLAAVDQLAARAEKAEGDWIAKVFTGRAAEERLTDEARAAWRLLTELMRMNFRSHDAKIPFDLQANEIAFLRTVLNRVTDCEVRARLADTLWLVTRDVACARDAIDAYLASSERLEDPQHWPPATERLERAARLARSLGKGDPLLSKSLDKVLERIRIYRGRDPLFFTCQLADLLYEFRFGDAAELAGYTLAGAEGARAEPEFNRARQYYEISAKLLARARDRDGFARARIAIAETFVEEAELREANGNFMAAHVAWTSAIIAYRKAPGGVARIPELQARLEAAASRMHERMRGFQHKVDFTESIEKAPASVEGLGLFEAILCFVTLPCVDVKDLRATTLRGIKDFPLQGLMPTKIFDLRGRLVEQAPSALASDPAEREAAVQMRMMQNADLHRWHMFHGYLQPIYYKIAEEHRLTEPRVWELVQGSMLIPPQREEFFVRGLAAGFRGDLLLAHHLLIPQIENALRWVLHGLGTIARAIDDAGIEEEWPLQRCLAAPKVVELFGEDLVYELRTLLIEKGGPNLRHLSMHGVMSPGEYRSLQSFYAWWLMLKMTFLLTPAVQQRLAAPGQNTEEDSTKQHPVEAGPA
jgi:hypothetical protein